MKKVSLNFIFIILIVSFVGTIIFGAILRHHYICSLAHCTDETRFKNLQKVAVFFAEIPHNIKFIFKNETLTGDVIVPLNEQTYDDKKFFDKKLNSSRNELILISRYDGDLGRSIVEIRDLNTFEVLHSYLPDIEEIYEKTDFSKEEFKNLKSDYGVNRFNMFHPAITFEGELIFQSLNSPLVKIDFNSKIVWVNDEDNFHHSINLDLDENIYVPSHKFPHSKKVASLIGNDAGYFAYIDDAITILNQDGKIIFLKSVSEILIEHGLIHRIFSGFKYDPIHLNDIQPVLKDGPYFKKGDLFLSLRSLNMIILYRPETNKIIKILEGGFLNQHDVDILDDKTISFYNNNVFYNYKSAIRTNNEILIYHFDTDSFSKKFEDTFKTLKINTEFSGLVDFLDDGSAIVEDTDNGRIFYINKSGEVIWEFNNLNSKKQIYLLFWARIISSEKANKIKQIIKKKN